MLLEVFREHNRKYRELMGKDYVAGTVLRYERTARYLEELLQKEYGMNDIPLKEINHEFITKFEHYVKTEKSCSPKCSRQVSEKSQEDYKSGTCKQMDNG